MGFTVLLSLHVFLAVATWQVVGGVTNLLVNPSFEDDLTGNWGSNGFTMERITGDVRDGNYSLKCSGRTELWMGPYLQNIIFEKGHHYAFEGYIKLLNDAPGKLWQIIRAMIRMTLPNKNNMLVTYKIAFRSFCSKADGWIHLKGDIEAPQEETSNTQIIISGPDPNIDFLVDNVTLYEVFENTNWRIEADTNIENHRKSDINLNVFLPSSLTPSDFDIEISLKSHLFAFGSMLRDYLVREQPTSEVMKRAYYLFNWATVQSYKWRFNKGVPPDTNPDFSNAVDATDILNAKGLKVRGHSVFWNVEKFVPDWVKALDDALLIPTLNSHIDYMINLARGKLVQWDIQNEHIAGHYYEEKLQDTSITKDMYIRARGLNDSAKLYLNEYQCITSGAHTEQYYDLAMEYLNEGIPLDGLGIQGHTKDYVKPDPTAMWRRIDRLAETGLDMMMTEFDLRWPNELERADWFEDTVRAFFGHPKMRGLILWRFWNETDKDQNTELVQGPDTSNIAIVEPGQRWACLTKKEWTTKETLNLGSGTSFSLRGFQGDYEVLVKRDGVPVQRELFTLGKEGAVWNLDIIDSTAEITVTAEVDYVPQCISHRAERSLGTGTTSYPGGTLTCNNIWSLFSGPEEGDSTSVECPTDYVMTGCFSFHKKKRWTRKGEKIEVDTATGQIKCTAFNGPNSPHGVKAVARCCKVSGLTCDYKTAGPSFPFDGAMAEARCDAGDLALGCSTYSAFPDSDGVKPKDDISSCVAQSGAPVSSNPAEKSGAHVFAACCRATGNLDCRVVASYETALLFGKTRRIRCPSGYVMTGCNTFAESGKSGGAKIFRRNGVDRCVAIMGDNLPAGSTGVRAYATCCRV